MTFSPGVLIISIDLYRLTAAKIILTIGAAGAVRTETFRVFSEDEYRKIVADLP